MTLHGRRSMPSRVDAERFFDAIAGRYERSYAPASEESRARMTRVLQELRGAGENLRVLDLGVGTGRELSALLDAGHAPTGLDVSQAMLDRCARRTRPISLVRADFWRALPFEDDSFDAAVALHGTLAHPPATDSIRRLAAELARVVRTGGVLVAEVPSPAWIDRVAASPDRRVRRTGPRTCVYEDLAARAAIDVRVLSDDEWRGALSPAWSIRVQPLTDVEQLVVARTTLAR